MQGRALPEKNRTHKSSVQGLVEGMRWDACEPQQSATSVHANATRPRLRARSSSFRAAISRHLRALSPAPAAAPPRRAVVGNPHSVSLAASSSPAPGAGARSRTAADSARRLTAAVSTRASAARMARTRAAQPPHIMPLTSSSTVAAPAPSASAAASTVLEADGSAVARGVPASTPRGGNWGRWRRREWEKADAELRQWIGRSRWRERGLPLGIGGRTRVREKVVAMETTRGTVAVS
ncbi:hypothetical protein EJB05_07853, partial [Eragrostis curvula]